MHKLRASDSSLHPHWNDVEGDLKLEYNMVDDETERTKNEEHAMQMQMQAEKRGIFGKSEAFKHPSHPSLPAYPRQAKWICRMRVSSLDSWHVRFIT